MRFYLLVYCSKVHGHQLFLGHFLKLFKWIRKMHVILYVGIFFKEKLILTLLFTSSERPTHFRG
jgi:hypothetical protein